MLLAGQELRAVAAGGIGQARQVNARPADSVLPSDFLWLPGFLLPAEDALLMPALSAGIDWEDHVLRMGGREIPMPRRIAFYGPFAYAYSGLVHPARPLPARLDELRVRVEQASGHPFNTLLANLYRNGSDSVSWHSDDDYPHGGHPAVASLSLGATRRFRIAHKHSRESWGLDLTAGGLLVMSGRSQLDYRHALPKSVGTTAPRINLTFRYMAASNR
jgi:alkylated DNA repair dioxygenase AlkB